MKIVQKSTQKRPKPAFPKALVKLSRKARQVRRRVLEEWLLSDADTVLLDRALSYSDLCDRYQAILDAEGLSIENPVTHATRPHPALAALKLSRQNYLTAWRMLGLKDPQTKNPPGRPVANYSSGEFAED